ncbi:hypothetical protein ABK040_006747 [Willaertia magna]
MSNKETCKVVAVGDGAVGKTCLLMVYVNNEFPEDYIPTVFDNYDTNVKFNDQVVRLSLWDTAGQEEYDRLRYLSYPNTNVFIVCYSISSKSSYDNVKEKWLKELNEYSKGTPIVLVATKADLRDDNDFVQKLEKNGEHLLTAEEGEKLAKEIGATCYIETSARTRKGVDEIFQKALQVRFSKGAKTGGGGNTGGGNSANTGKDGCCILM